MLRISYSVQSTLRIHELLRSHEVAQSLVSQASAMETDMLELSKL